MKVKYLVVGSGIGGLAAGAELKSKGEEDFLIVDKCNSLPLNLSNGVHYLHSDDFGMPFSFELKEIISTEEIWNPRKDEFKKTAHIPEMIDYSLKVMNLRHPSSIMDPSSRVWKTYIPMSNNMNDLLQAYFDYIGVDKFFFGINLIKVDPINKIAKFQMGTQTDLINYKYLITTVPMNCFADTCELNLHKEFKNQPVHITNYQTKNIVPNWLICLYISDNKFPVYRITVLNNILSMESLTKLTSADEHITKYHLDRYFEYELETKKDYCWETGRIWGLLKSEREELLSGFAKLDIYPLGRYGQWDGKLTMDTTILQAKEIINKII